MKLAANPSAVVTVALINLALPACGSFAQQQTAPQVAESAHSVPNRSREPERARAQPRKVGDFSVHRFSGSYQKAPLTLSEEVMGQEFGLWVIDYTFEEQTGTTKLRVRFNPRTDAVFSVAKLDGVREVSVPIAVYDRLIERTSFAADENDGVVSESHATCLVGPNELDCETKTYKVRVGDQSAKLSVSRSDQVEGGDVTGDITMDDGTLVYRSELVEIGNAASPKHGVATR